MHPQAVERDSLLDAQSASGWWVREHSAVSGPAVRDMSDRCDLKFRGQRETAFGPCARGVLQGVILVEKGEGWFLYLR